MGQIEEASRITQFWAETQAISADEVTIKDYITEFMKKYPCRGIPVVVDVLDRVVRQGGDALRARCTSLAAAGMRRRGRTRSRLGERGTTSQRAGSATFSISCRARCSEPPTAAGCLTCRWSQVARTRT